MFSCSIPLPIPIQGHLEVLSLELSLLFIPSMNGAVLLIVGNPLPQVNPILLYLRRSNLCFPKIQYSTMVLNNTPNLYIKVMMIVLLLLIPLLLLLALMNISYQFVHPSICLAVIPFVESGQQMELDIYIPAYSLAFEYQGKHHYQDHYLFGTAAKQALKVI